MEYDCANKFYLKLKNVDAFNDDLYSLFFSYFEKTWFTCKSKKNKEKSKFPFQLWSYYYKLKSNNILNDEEIVSIKDFEEYISFTNNFCESLNSYIKTFIPINQQISVNLFIEVIKNLFKKNSIKRMKNENIKDKTIPIKRNMSDVFIEILEITKGSKIITNEEISKIKHNLDEEDLYDLIEKVDNDDDI